MLEQDIMTPVIYYIKKVYTIESTLSCIALITHQGQSAGTQWVKVELHDCMLVFIVLLAVFNIFI